jgi:DNA replication protein DnaC
MRELIRPQVLILDDFAKRQMTATQPDDLYELVSERQGRCPISTSNRATSDWYFPAPQPRRCRIAPGRAYQNQLQD